MKALKLIRIVCAVVFVSGIAGMIISSIAGNNEGWVLTAGSTTAVAALVLLGASSASHRSRIDVFNDVAAERIEARIQDLVAQGASEDTARQLVRDSIDFAKGIQ